MKSKKDIGFAVRRLSNLIKRDVEISCARIGIEYAKGINGRAVHFLYENRDRDIFQKDFEKQFSVRRSTASVMLKTMEQKGLIKRESVDGDARLKRILLTEKAYKIHKLVVDDIADREDRMRRNISQDELNVFFSVIEKMSQNLEEQDDKDLT